MHVVWILMTMFTLGLHVQAQSVTAPFSVSQRLMNPAAAVTRPLRSVALNFENSQENSKVLGLVGSEISEKIEINQLVAHASGVFQQKWFVEVDGAYQAGTKNTKNEFSDQGAIQTNNNKNEINLMPVQIQAGRVINSSFNLGLKLLATFAKVDTSSIYSTSFEGQNTSSTSNNKLDGRLIVLGMGTVYNVNKFFSVSYAADFNQFNFDRNIQGQSTFASTGNSQHQTNIDIQSSTVTTIRRDILGLGFSSGNTKGNAFRSEISVERLTPLSIKANLKDGIQIRATAEAQWSYFHLGAEYITREGYMIDSYDLIPYFFKFEEFSNQKKVDYGIYGGLKSSKGHSFSASLTVSTENVEQQLSVSDSNVYPMERKSQKLGLSYSYVF
jgi:hypothetical protein